MIFHALITATESAYLMSGDRRYLDFLRSILTSGLGQMTMGAPFPCFNGGLLCARVRYFDLDCRRPGLPQDVAALVEKLAAKRTVVHLVNTSALETRRLIVQAGAYGEHAFTEVAYDQGKQVPVNGKYFAVEMGPATSIRLDIGTRCYVNRPTYAFPWD